MERNEHIETLRGRSDDAAANEIQAYANQLENAPTQHGCFCKEAVRAAFINQFFNWYDEQLNQHDQR